MTTSPIPAESVAAEIAQALTESGMKLIARDKYPEWPDSSQAFEDEYTVTAVWIFDSVTRLLEDWGRAQDLIIELLGSNVPNNDPKSWDGYLILVAMGAVSEELVADLSRVRMDTRRVRKLVVTAEDLPSRASRPLEVSPPVRRALAPLLELDIDVSLGRLDPLTTLPDRITGDKDMATSLMVLASAYEANEPLLESLHLKLTQTREGKRII